MERVGGGEATYRWGCRGWHLGVVGGLVLGGEVSGGRSEREGRKVGLLTGAGVGGLGSREGECGR